MESTKAPDRITISKDSRKIVDTIDKKKYHNLHLGTSTRSELFSFAMAVGCELDIDYETEGKGIEGLVLDKSIDPRTKAFMYAYVISKYADKNTLDEVQDKSYVYEKVQNIANLGFQLIEEDIESNYEKSSIWSYLNELDKLYNNLREK